MLSLSQFRRNVFSIFNIARDTGSVFEIVYKNKVYLMEVRRTDREPHLTRSKRESKSINLRELDAGECPVCGSLMVSGICMNSACIGSNKIAV